MKCLSVVDYAQSCVRKQHLEEGKTVNSVTACLLKAAFNEKSNSLSALYLPVGDRWHLLVIMSRIDG